MRREYWLALALAGFLMMLPLGPLSFCLLLFVPGFALLVVLKERFDLVELFAYSFTLSILAFSLAVLIAWFAGAMHLGAVLLGLLTIGVAAYKYRRGSGIELAEAGLQWPVLGIALAVFAVTLYLMLKTFTLTPAGFMVDTTHASDLNFFLSIAQHYIASPHIPPEDPYLPGYDVVYNWFMYLLFGELGVLTGVDLFVIFKVIVPLVSALIFLNAFLLARSIFKSGRDALVASIVYVAVSGLSWAFIAYQVFIVGNPQPDIFKEMVYEWPGIMTLKYDPTSLYFFLPQTQTFGLMAMAFGFLLYLETLRTRSMRYAIVAGLALASLALFHMITAFPVFLALGIYFLGLLTTGILGYCLENPSKYARLNSLPAPLTKGILAGKRDAYTTALAAIPLMIAAAASLYQLSILQQGNASQVILGHNPDVPLTILMSIGLLIPFALYGMYLKRGAMDGWLLILFAALNLILVNVLELPATVNTYRFLVYMALPVSLFAGLAFSRWLPGGRPGKRFMAMIVALAAFDVLGFILVNVVELPAIYRLLADIVLLLLLFSVLALSLWQLVRTGWRNPGRQLMSVKTLKAAIAASVILLMVPSTLILIGFYDNSPYTHATPMEYDALVWLRDNTPKNAIIFEEPGFFPRVPVLTGRDVAYSGEIYTLQYHNVDLQSDAYGIMSITDPSALHDKLSQYRVDYVFLGQRESVHPFVAALQDQQYFRPVYDQGGVKIYEVVGNVPPQETNHMEISFMNWLAFFAALIYLLILPGFSIMRTTGWYGKLTSDVEKVVVTFGISAIILLVVAMLVAMPFSIGLNFYTLIIPETLIIILTTKEVVEPIRRMIKA